MQNDLFARLEETFYSYAEQYDQNIKSLIKQRGIEVSSEELDEILKDAKLMTGGQGPS